MTHVADAVKGRVMWYELLTTDMKAAEKFYTNVVGWTVQPFEGSPQPYDMWVRPAGQPVGGVMTIPEGMNFPPHWEMYVGVDNFDQAVAQIKRLGGGELGPALQIPNVGRLQTMTDAQGAVFAILEPASPAQGPETPAEVGGGSWHELMTTDAEAAMSFYTELFGWKPTETMDMGPMGKYHMFGRAFPLGGMMNKLPEMAQVPPNWGLYFRVPEINAAAERVKAGGGQILNGPMEVPGGDMIVNCMDPQGAAFSLHAKKS
jgi:predicted enzyme related to lactoylglutathione lyase